MDTSIVIAENYLERLESLSREAKLWLAEKLTNSTKTEENTTKEEKLKVLFGSWKDNRSAEDIISDIYNSRSNNTRHLESFE